MTDILDTTDAPLSRTPAQFFFETGYFAAYAEACIAAGNKPPFDLTDAIVTRAWDIAGDAHPDRAEFDRYLSRADSADDELRAGEAHYRAHFAAERESTGSREELETCARSLRTYGAELFPVNRDGKAHFARLIMDTVANTIDATLARRSGPGLFIVWSPDGGDTPTVRHKSHRSAFRAAHRLSQRHPGRTFMVMQKTGKRICVEASA